MPAMTMEFPVSAGDAAARGRASGSAPTWWSWTRPATCGSRDLAGRQGGARLGRRRGAHAAPGHVREGQARPTARSGTPVPDFVLYDQDGRVVDSARFRGKQVMLNFIYSRCPVANMCPLSTTKMMATQKLAREAGVTTSSSSRSRSTRPTTPRASSGVRRTTAGSTPPTSRS
jgi:protein SCO1/2